MMYLTVQVPQKDRQYDSMCEANALPICRSPTGSIVRLQFLRWRRRRFNAAALPGTPPQDIANLIPGGRIGLFMGSRTLRDAWPGVTAWSTSHA